MSARSWLVRFESVERPMPMNKWRTLHYHERANWDADVRQWFRALAIKAHVPKRLGAVTVDAWPLHADNRSPQDVGACAPAVKAAIDGLTDAGCWDDDDRRHVTAITYHPPKVCGTNGLELLVTEVTAPDDTAPLETRMADELAELAALLDRGGSFGEESEAICRARALVDEQRARELGIR